MKSLRLLLVLLTPALLFWGCSKEKSFEVGNNTVNGWEFFEGSGFFKGGVDTAYLTEISPGVTGFLMQGLSDDGKGTITLGVLGLNTSVPGTYKTPQVIFDYSSASATLYQNDLSATDQFTIEVTKIDSASIQGTFFGQVKDTSGNLKTIASGKFSARFGTSVTQPGDAQLTFWSKNSCSAAGSGEITIKLTNGQTGAITGFTASAPSCGAAGAANFSVPAGTYGYEAICGTDTLRGVVNAAANQCLRQEIVFGPPATSAQYSLVSSAGSCSNYQVNGTYYAGKALSQDTNTIVVQVNVTQVGAYSISTNTLNGYSFLASGVFINTGIQNVTLKAQGTPNVTSTNNFTATAGSSTCTFSVNVLAALPATSLNTWSFTQGSRTYSGVFSSPGFFGDDPFNIGKFLYLGGEIAGTDTLMDLVVQYAASATQPVPGTYVTDPDIGSTNFTDWYLYDDASGDDIFYVKDVPTPTPPNVKLTIIITSYDATTKIVKGTFSGTAWNAAGTIVTISNGKFESEIEF